MKKQAGSQYRDGFVLGTLLIVILLITLYVPVISYISLFFLPIPIAIYGYRYGWMKSALLGVMILFSISVFAFYFFVMSLPIALVAILAGVFVGEALRSKRHPYEVWGRGTIGYAIGFLILLLMIQLLSDQSLITEYQLIIKESLDSVQILLGQAGIDLSADDLRAIEKDMLMMIELVPAILIVISMLYSFITQWFTHKVLNRLNQTQLAFPKFRLFQLPKAVLWIYFFVVIFSMFKFDGFPMLSLVLFNTSLVLGVLFSLQGLSLIIYYFGKKKQPKVVLIMLIIFILLFLPVGMYLTRILGIIDVGFRLRKMIK